MYFSKFVIIFFFVYRSLADTDFFSKSDPMCVVLESSSLINSNGNNFSGGFVEVGRTSKISNNLNPEWSEKIRLNYFFEMKQPIRFEM